MALTYTVIRKHDDLGALANKVVDAKVIGFDIETYKYTGGPTLDPLLGGVRLAQFRINGEETFIVDVKQCKNIDPLLAAMRKSKALWIIHNLKFEQKWFWHHYNFEFWPAFDTFRASALCYNGKIIAPFTEKGQTSNTLDSVILRELGETPDNTGQGASDWSKPRLTKLQLDYAAEDVLRLDRVYKALRARMEQLGLLQTALIEFGVCLPEGIVELNGLPVNREKWTTLARRQQAENRKLAEELFYELPDPYDTLALPGMNGGWNLNSTQQLLTSLNKMGVKVEKTDRITLTMQVAKFPILEKLLKYRKLKKRESSFGEKWLACIHPETGRVHSDYYSMLKAGRYSSSKPNLQQIPREFEYRDCFQASPGKVMILADYAGIEMRIVAEMANDPRLIEVFCSGADAHYATAALIMNKPVSEVAKNERQMAKPVNFGFIYGMQAKKLVLYAFGNYGVAMTEKQAQGFRNAYFSRDRGYAAIARWHDRVIREGHRSKMARTLSGRLRYLDPNKDFNEFYNTPVQGTGADALKRSMREVHNIFQAAQYGDRVKMVHHVHDEIILEVDDDPELIAQVKLDLETGMIAGMAPFLSQVPIVVDASHGESWAEAK